ncbi:ABC transporter permease [Aeromicrobium sp. CTD01-1L150]|uniref:ABC transporter permease n=1 Tax=Aeromicrobium sp. CTD01-1L150 TaxID=3341830 RepID=UPI0035C0F383
MTEIARKVALAVALPIILIATWWFATANSTSFFWPPLSQIVEVFPRTWFEGRFTADVVPSVVRLLIGYSIALVLGIGVGLAVGSSRILRETAEPVLEFLRAVPPPVLVPVIMLFAGIGDGMKVSVIAFGCIWPILLNTVEGVRGVDEVLSDTARTYRLGTTTRVRSLVLRAASPQIMAGARQALSVGIILMVISEMFAASNGLGFTTVQFQRSFAIPEMWTGIILLGLIGVVLAMVFRIVERRVLSWYLGLRTVQRKG